MRQLLHDISGFFFPVICPVCGIPIQVPDTVLCLSCEFKMPVSHYSADPENPVAQLFWGRVDVKGATSLFRFEKGSKYQSLLHRLKYQGEKKMGIYLGRLLGIDLLSTNFCRPDFIVPVPLHRRKKKKRGYNQSEVISFGISEMMGIPVNTEIIFRQQYTESQTRKGRFERWKNMDDKFALTEAGMKLSNITLLLIDDVVTTGSTLEACTGVLLKLPGVEVYVATVASA